MIKEFKDFKETQGYGVTPSLAPGGYETVIKSSTLKENSIGQYIEMDIDIAEGAYKGFYSDDYNRQTEEKKWRGKYFLSVPIDEDSSPINSYAKRRFKTFTDALEGSNLGYKFDWDEAKFKGLHIGGLFNKREYKKKDGTIGHTVGMVQVTTVDKIRTGDYTLPPERTVKNDGQTQGNTDEPEFVSVPDDKMKDLPFNY